MFISLIRQKALYVSTVRRMPQKKLRTYVYVSTYTAYTYGPYVSLSQKCCVKLSGHITGRHGFTYVRTYHIRRYSELIQSCRCDAFHKNGSLRVFTHVRTYMRNVTQLRTTYSKPESTYDVPSLLRLHLRTSYRKGRNGAKQGR